MSLADSTCNVWITNANGKRTDGKVHLQTWDHTARIKRVAKCWILCWVASLITVIIPLAHFILVPGFFIAGPIGAWILSKQKSVILGGQGICPTCNELLPIARSQDRWPLTDLCTKCQTSVVIEKCTPL